MLVDNQCASVDELKQFEAVRDEELEHYEKQIAAFRAGQVGDTKMQKYRLQFGTYAQRQEGVQMQRIKIPGGYLTADQLNGLADLAEKFASGLIHFTTRQDAQLYYVMLEDVPTLLRGLGDLGITTREACGNTVRNITSCYRAGVAADEIFDVYPYANALCRFLLRNKYNQNLGRKVKFAFEGCPVDHSALAFHDLGFHAVTREVNGRPTRGFRVHIGGGLGSAPQAAQIYSEFLPVEELFNFTAAVIRVFDRFGERKQRMKARMKFLVQSMGWEVLRSAIDAERKLIGVTPEVADLLIDVVDETQGDVPRQLAVLDTLVKSDSYRRWADENVILHRMDGYRGVHVRTKLGDVTADEARAVADIARRYSRGELRVSIEQNLFLSWVCATSLPALYNELGDKSLNHPGAETVADITACPGADTCRLGIASAKGLASELSTEFDEGSLAPFREANRDLRIKISGCPNGCAQHAISSIGFHAAALSSDGRNVPAHILFLGGRANHGNPKAARIIGKYPARASTKLVETLLTVHNAEKLEGEDFNRFIDRVGEARIKELLEPFKAIPKYENDPGFYDDFGHENERFTIRSGVRGECAGSTIAEVLPRIEDARAHLNQATAYLHHGDYEAARIEACEAGALAARVPLYRHLVDPFTNPEAFWEFENIFVRSGRTGGAWVNVAATFDDLTNGLATETSALEALEIASSFVKFCAGFESA